MKCVHTFCAGLLMACVIGSVAGCGSKPNDPKPGNPPKPAEGGAHVHHGKGPNGGTLIDFGAQHAELTIDHAKQEVTVFILTPEETDLKSNPVACKELTLNTKATTTTKDKKPIAAMKITLLPVDEKDGKATKFVGTGPGLGPDEAEFEGILLGEVNGKPAQGEFKE